MPSAPIIKTGAFTISDSDIAANYDSVTYVCTGVFSITIPATGITAGNMFTIMSTDGKQTFTETGTITKPLYRNALPYGSDASMVITCTSTGNYKLDGDLEIVASVNEPDFAFRVSKTSEAVDQSIATATFDKITWSDSVYSINIAFDFTNNEFTVPSTGVWSFKCHADFSGTTADSDQVLMSLYVDGTAQSLGLRNKATGVNKTIGTMVTADIYLTAGQTVSTYVYHTDAGALVRFEAANTYFSGHKVSGTSTGVEYDNYDIAFKAMVGTQYTPASNSWADIKIDTVVFDIGGNFDTSTYTFTAPVSGIYMFSVLLHGIAVDDKVRVLPRLSVNGTYEGIADIFISTATTSNITPVVTWGSIELNAGDLVKFVSAYSAGISTYDVGIQSSLWGHLVKATTKAECSFSANLGGVDDTTSITAQAAAKVPLSNVDFDYGNNFDTVTNNRFTAPEDGRYFFSFSVGISTLITTTADFTAILRKNGNTVKVGSRGANTGVTNSVSSGSDVLDLLKGEYVELWVYQSESISETIRGNSSATWLSGYRLVSSQDTPKNINDLSDVDTAGISTGDLLKYDGTNFVPITGATGSFISADGTPKTITVTNGVITAIV